MTLLKIPVRILSTEVARAMQIILPLGKSVNPCVNRNLSKVTRYQQ